MTDTLITVCGMLFIALGLATRYIFMLRIELERERTRSATAELGYRLYSEHAESWKQLTQDIVTKIGQKL